MSTKSVYFFKRAWKTVKKTRKAHLEIRNKKIVVKMQLYSKMIVSDKQSKSKLASSVLKLLREIALKWFNCFKCTMTSACLSSRYTVALQGF